jgi:hypothetical protein
MNLFFKLTSMSFALDLATNPSLIFVILFLETTMVRLHHSIQNSGQEVGQLKMFTKE